jgi:hypothetical protein
MNPRTRQVRTPAGPVPQQLAYIERLATELGISPPLVATSRAAAHVIRGLKLMADRRRREQP